MIRTARRWRARPARARVGPVPARSVSPSRNPPSVDPMSRSSPKSAAPAARRAHVRPATGRETRYSRSGGNNLPRGGLGGRSRSAAESRRPGCGRRPPPSWCLLPLTGLVGAVRPPDRSRPPQCGALRGRAARHPRQRPTPVSHLRIASALRRHAPSPQAIPSTASRRARRAPAAPVKIATSGPGTFHTANLGGRGRAASEGKLLRYRVRVEKGLPFDPETTAIEIHRTLSDRRSWAGSGRWRMQAGRRRPAGRLQRLVATPRTTDRLCAPLLTRGNVSCQSGNEADPQRRRWAFGVSLLRRDVDAYRVYLANHEVGHILGYGHQNCRPGPGGAGDAATDQGAAGLPGQPVAVTRRRG